MKLDELPNQINNIYNFEMIKDQIGEQKLWNILLHFDLMRVHYFRLLSTIP